MQSVGVPRNNKPVKKKLNIGIISICTGKYEQYREGFIKSFSDNFCAAENVKFFIFTDNKSLFNINIFLGNNDSKENYIYYSNDNWVQGTLMRFHLMDQYKDEFKDMDYLYFIDIDMVCREKIVFNEVEPVINRLIGVQHPGFVNQRGTYETRKESKAYVKNNEGKIYYQGCFFGGIKEAFLQMCAKLKENIATDINNKITAIWHDESHLNRYFIDNHPTALTPAYAYPEKWDTPYEKKIVHLLKNNKELHGE